MQSPGKSAGFAGIATRMTVKKRGSGDVLAKTTRQLARLKDKNPTAVAVGSGGLESTDDVNSGWIGLRGLEHRKRRHEGFNPLHGAGTECRFKPLLRLHQAVLNTSEVPIP